MSNTDMHSIYNNLPDKMKKYDNPLSDLLPYSYDSGWHTARNALKPLNHLHFLKQKEKTAEILNLHNIKTPTALFNRNYSILENHQAGKVDTHEAIKLISMQLKNNGVSIGEKEMMERLRDYATITHMEFHPSDICNLTCHGCTYGHDDEERKPPPLNYSFDQIPLIARFRPKSMVIIGGGEPVLYTDGNKRFEDIIEMILTTNPGIQLALITNGTYKPPGNWPKEFQWIRISLDAASDKTFANFRGKKLFSQVIENFLEYLTHDIRYVGISFLFCRSNIHDYATVAKYVFDLIKKENPHALHKVNIQYRPLRRDPYLYDQDFDEAITVEDIEETVREIQALAKSSPEIKEFLVKQTNITAILGGNSHPPHEFSRCYYSQIFRIIRANGELRPCFIRVVERDFVLGNIYTDSLEKIALNTLYVSARRKIHCSPKGCRQCHVNYILEQGLRGNIQPSDSKHVLSDPMF